jgi:hypothetical protein
MTAKQDTTLKLEDVPLKRDFRLQRESLPKDIEKTFDSDGSGAVILFGDH